MKNEIKHTCEISFKLNNEEFSAYKVGKKYSGCLLDGKEYKEYPKEHV